MARRLKGGMPKLFKDNRCPAAKRFREIYEDVGKRFLLTDGLARRIGGLTAKAWLDYETITRELTALTGPRLRLHVKQAVVVNRLRRRQSSLVGAFLGGLRTLEAMNNKTGGQDLAKAFEHALRAEQEGLE
jgi:hypothetical protein